MKIGYNSIIKLKQVEDQALQTAVAHFKAKSLEKSSKAIKLEI